jgi:sulfur carrier protein
MTQIEITLNGRPFPLSPDQSIRDLLRALSLPSDGRGVAVALDGEVVFRDAWESTRLDADHRVEILIATQGG